MEKTLKELLEEAENQVVKFIEKIMLIEDFITDNELDESMIDNLENIYNQEYEIMRELDFLIYKCNIFKM